MKYSEFKERVLEKGSGTGTKTFYIVPIHKNRISTDKLYEFPIEHTIEILINKKGRKTIKFGNSFPDPMDYNFFFDQQIAEAHTVKILAEIRQTMVDMLQNFDQRTDYNTRLKTSLELHPELLI